MTETIKRTIHEYDTNGKLIKETIEAITREDSKIPVSGYFSTRTIPETFISTNSEVEQNGVNVNGARVVYSGRIQNEEPRMTYERT